MTFKLSRDPALWLTVIATSIRLIGAFFFEISPEQQAWLNAVATAGASLYVAFAVRRDGQVPALLGFAQAIIALAVGYGADLSAEQQAVIMSIIGALAAAFTRTQVTAKVTADGDKQLA